MVNPTHEEYCRLVIQEFNGIIVPSGPVRRIDADIYAEQAIRYITRDLRDAENLFENHSLNIQEVTDLITELSLETTSILYSLGAETIVWRHWASIGTIGKFLLNQLDEAALYAALAGEWIFLQNLPTMPIRSQQISDLVFWQLVSGTLITEPLDRIDSNYDNAWLQLSQSIPSQDHNVTENCLKTIADFWIMESEDDWSRFHLRSYPDFELYPCAVAALARHYGFTPSSLTSDQYKFLEAGLSIPEPSKLFS